MDGSQEIIEPEPVITGIRSRGLSHLVAPTGSERIFTEWHFPAT
jgi:hypothetical protein